MSTFLAIGLGPIQTGIFLRGAAQQFDRLVVAEVDDNVKNAVNADGGHITINIASADSIHHETFSGIEILNPLKKDDLATLIQVAADADEIATALPSVNFFPQVAEYLKAGFLQNPDKQRFIYTAENNNHAAEELAKAVGCEFRNTYFLNTVIGKMSSVVSAEDCEFRNLQALSPHADRGHLVEEFNNILISTCPIIDARQVSGLYVKKDLYPFEEAKLYGHNAIHFLMATLGNEKGLTSMNELVAFPEIIEFAKFAFINESGKALCCKWSGFDELFTEKGFKNYVENLIPRMINPFLMDSIPRIIRDLPRKLAWNDRVVGTMRMALEHNIQPNKLAQCAATSVKSLFGTTTDIKNGLTELWPKPWHDEHEQIFKLIINFLP